MPIKINLPKTAVTKHINDIPCETSFIGRLRLIGFKNIANGDLALYIKNSSGHTYLIGELEVTKVTDSPVEFLNYEAVDIYVKPKSKH